MTDAETKRLVERLLEGTFPIGEPDPLCAEAAATITRLTAERDEARAECERHLLTVIALVDAAGGQIDVYPDDIIGAPRRMLWKEERTDSRAVRFKTRAALAAQEPK